VYQFVVHSKCHISSQQLLSFINPIPIKNPHCVANLSSKLEVMFVIPIDFICILLPLYCCVRLLHCVIFFADNQSLQKSVRFLTQVCTNIALKRPVVTHEVPKVLVVGAGPVGLMTAIQTFIEGADVSISIS
jgi:NADPH-dependent 2,4-dienoyl-CoA reductase/sulfur reductase-like enzyme